MSKKIPCGGFELDDTLEVREGKLGLAGGTGGIRTAIIKSSLYNKVLAGEDVELSEETFECINMTYEEAVELMLSGEPLSIIVMKCHNSRQVRITSAFFDFSKNLFYFTIYSLDGTTYNWDGQGITIQGAPNKANGVIE